MDTISLGIIIANSSAWLMVIGVEFLRRQRADPVIIPYAALLMAMSLQLLLVEQVALFRCVMVLVILISIREAKHCVTENRAEVVLATTLLAGLCGLGVVVWWLVVQINTHLQIGIG